MIHLFRTKRFLPLFVCQFFGAFNDNLFKNALVILVTYVVAEKAGFDAQLIVTLAAGLFILPFFLFSATAGQLADKYEKSALIQKIKIAEIGLMIGASSGFYFENVWILLTILFLMGTQSTFFGPLKYSLLPDHLKEEELIAGNALIETGTFLSILIGTIAGGLLILAEGGVTIVSVLIIAMAMVGWQASRFIPEALPHAPELKIRWNILAETWAIIKQCRERSDVFLSIIGISWFWFVGATFLAQFPTFAKDVLMADEQVVTLFLAIFSVGIGIGSMLCTKLLGDEVSGSFAAPAALGMALFTIALYAVTPQMDLTDEMSLQSIGMFLQAPAQWGILVSLLLIAVSGGVYIVPLYAIMQARSDKRHTARVIAGNNIINALFMVASAVFTLVLLAMSWTVTDVFLLMGLVNIPIAYLVRQIVRIEQAKRKGNTHA